MLQLIRGSHNQEIYGGGNVGNVEGSTNVYIKGGNSTNIYAGGRSSDATSTYLYLQGGIVENIYGGSNITGVVETSHIETTSGNVNTIYGGNNIGGTNNESNILINGGIVGLAVYGGGNQISTNTTNVELVNSDTAIPSVFGGGNQAGVTQTFVYAKGANVEKLFGGSNIAGNVQTSNVYIQNGNLGDVYGGNNQGDTTETTNVFVTGGTVQNIYGGGNKAQTTQSYMQISSGTINNVYGGGNEAGLQTSNIETHGGHIQNIFGGSNISGDVITSNITTNGTNLSQLDKIENVYGGNNQGGKTTTANVTIYGGNVIDVYGGGNEADTNATNVTINGNISGSVYGGGNLAGVDANTNVSVLGGTIQAKIYGGGNEGAVGGSTFVHVKNATINENVYAGGKGVTAIVYENTNIIVDGTTTNIIGSVFGGGDRAATGLETVKNSVSTVNIVGGQIGKNVYGGANTSVVYGVTNTNIGYDAVADGSLEKGDIIIDGTVFGGGEANESGDENYDFSYISVTNGINIQINGNSHNEFLINGSIFGSGNASSTSGDSYISIQNYGSVDAPKSNISIQRTNCLTISNSAIALSGATDRTNEYSSTYFTISRVDEVKLKNNSTLYLNCGANLLKKFSSLVDINGTEQIATVTINEEAGITTKNVDNRIYMLEGNNLNIATNEQVTAYGEVIGMTFLGLFTNRINPSTSTGLYNSIYDNGDTITNLGTFSANSYVMAAHKTNHNTLIDGFYTNYNVDGKIRVNYIDTTPKEGVYYIWLVGEKMEVTVFDINLTASKYATLGTTELPLTGFSDPNIRFVLSGFSLGLMPGISLINPDEILAIAPDDETANNVYGLVMKSGNNGWQTGESTTFLTEDNGSYLGTSEYLADNSSITPSLNFCFYHSQNITNEGLLGDIKIRFHAIIPIDDLNSKIAYIDINITLSTALYQDDFFEAAITPGEEFGLFTNTETNITNKSTFSTYYSLYIPEFSTTEYYEDYDTYSRILVSVDDSNVPFILPEGTKITMLDMVTNKYYYYNVTRCGYNIRKI